MQDISNFAYGEKYHNPYIVRIKQFFENKGATVIYTGVEHIVPDDLRAIIRHYKSDLTAFHLRGHGDMFVTFDDTYSYYIECKVMTADKSNPKIARKNTMLEASALAIHYNNAKIGIRTIYCILDPFAHKDYGILLDEKTYCSFQFNDNTIWWFKQSHNTLEQATLTWQLNTVFAPRILQHYNYDKYGESADPMILVQNSNLLPLEEIIQGGL